MSRSGYDDGCGDEWALIRWRGAVKSAIRGKRGQAFLRDLADALDALPEKRLIAGELKKGDCVCAIGSLGLRRGLDMSRLDPDDSAKVAATFDIGEALAREVVFENDEGTLDWKETPEARWQRMRRWVASQIAADKSAHPLTQGMEA